MCYEIRGGDVVLFRDRLFKVERKSGPTGKKAQLLPVKMLSSNRGYVSDGRPQWFNRSSVENNSFFIESIERERPS